MDINKPTAIRYDFDGYGYQYIDSGSGSDWQTRVKGEPLYAHPAKDLTDELEGAKLVILRLNDMLRQQQEKLEFSENRLKLSDDAFDALERKVRGLQEDLTKTNLLLSKVVEERNDAYAEIKKLQEAYKVQAILLGVK